MTGRVRSVLVLAFVVAAVSSAIVAGQVLPAGEHPAGFADPVLGRWDLTVEGVEGAYPSWLHIHMRKDTQLQANFVGRFGSVRCATVTDFDNGQLTVVIPVQYEAQKTDLKFVGKVVGDRLEGTTEDEKGRTIKWTAVRAPASTPTRTATWGAPIQLLNQTDMNGWHQRSTAKGTCWSVADGVLTNKTPCADLITDRTFTDFKLHVELMFPPKSNSGVYLRGRYEVQIEDDAGKPVDSHRMGGVYGFLAPYTNAVKPAGEWQAYDITLIGRRLSVVLNDTVIIDNEIIPGITGGAIDSRESEPGPLMLQGDHGKVSFRNITLTPAQ